MIHEITYFVDDETGRRIEQATAITGGITRFTGMTEIIAEQGNKRMAVPVKFEIKADCAADAFVKYEAAAEQARNEMVAEKNQLIQVPGGPPPTRFKTG